MKLSGLFRRRTKIVCTIGPASGSSAIIEQLMRAGMNIARLNLSHGTLSLHSGYIQRLREVGHRLGTNVAILVDLPGPKYRVIRLKGGQVFLEKGALVNITAKKVEGDAALIPVNFPNFTKDVKVGDRILLNDGAIQLKVTARDGEETKCRVIVGGLIAEGSGLVIPGARISIPFLTEYLREGLFFAINERPDYLALSFVSDAEDIARVQAIIHESGSQIPVIAKIERGEAVRKFDSILAISDGIMVARGDLGVEIPLERVPLVQKEIIKKCNHVGKPVITATQMLESMVNAARPTRAEVNDIANSIFDGTDATMLSAETSIGKYPIEAVKTMTKVAEETESKLPYEQLLSERDSWLEQQTDELISYSACHTASRLGAKAIVAFTESGSTAGRVSKYRPKAPIIALTPSGTLAGRMMLRWGVYSIKIEEPASVDGLFAAAVKIVKDFRIAKSGDLIVITGGIPIGIAGTTNLLKVERIT